MIESNDEFSDDVLACVEDLNTLLPQLVKRYPQLVVVAALAEHVGSALRVFVRTGVCTAEQAREVLEHVEQIAFAMNGRTYCPDLPR